MKTGIPMISTDHGAFPIMQFKQETWDLDQDSYFETLAESPADMLRIAVQFRLPAFCLPDGSHRNPAPATDHAKLSLRRPAPPQTTVEDRAAVAASNSVNPYRARLPGILDDQLRHYEDQMKSMPPVAGVAHFIPHHRPPLPVTRQSQPEDSHPKTIP